MESGVAELNVVVIVVVRQMSQWENEFCREMKPMKKYKIASCCLCLIPALVMSGDKFDINQHISFIGMEWRGNEMRKRTRMTGTSNGFWACNIIYGANDIFWLCACIFKRKYKGCISVWFKDI